MIYHIIFQVGALFAPPPQAPPSGVKGSVEQNLMSFLDLPWLKTYKLIYIMKIENLDNPPQSAAAAF